MSEDFEIRNGRPVEAGDEDPVNSQWDEDTEEEERYDGWRI